jgi:hypothetical protein
MDSEGEHIYKNCEPFGEVVDEHSPTLEAQHAAGALVGELLQVRRRHLTQASDNVSVGAT